MGTRFALSLVVASAAATLPSPAGAGLREAAGTRTPAPRAVEHSRGVAFEANEGQWDPRVRFVARARGYRALLCADEVILRAASSPPAPRGPAVEGPPAAEESVVRLRFAGPARWRGGAPLARRSSYFLGRDPSRWRRAVPSHASAAADTARGVTMEWAGAPGRALEYAFRVAPGADPRDAGFTVEGARRLSVQRDGSLRVETATGAFVHGAPVLYEETATGRVAVDGGFEVRTGNRVGFRVGARDPGRPLVIDPVVTFTALVGGASEDLSEAISVTADGGILLTGRTDSTDYPVSPPGSERPGGLHEVGVTRLGPDGSVEWSTYLGGGSGDLGTCIAAGPGGAVFVAGHTYSGDFPLVGALDSTFVAESSAFLLRLENQGTELAFSTYLGGETKMATYPPRTVARSMILDASGRPVLTGETTTTDMPTTAGALQESAGGDTFDAFVACYEPDGSALAWCTYLGGAGDEKGTALALAPDGSILVVGSHVKSTVGFPVVGGVPGLNVSYNPGSFFARLSGDGSSLVWSWLLRYGASTYVTCVAAASDGSMVAAGRTRGILPATEGAFQTSRAGINENDDAFLLRTNAAGDALAFATYLGGALDDYAAGLVVAPNGEAVLFGVTSSSDFPVAGPIHGDRAHDDTFLTRFAADGTALRFSTYFGSAAGELAYALAWRDGVAYAAGGTGGDNLPGADVLPSYRAGEVDGFVALFDFRPSAPTGLVLTPVPGPSVLVEWTDASSDETGFEIERRTGDEPWDQVASPAAGTEIALDEWLDPLTAYEYRIRSRNEDGASAWSGPVEVTTLDRTPLPPSLLEATAVAPRSITLSWTEEAQNETGYEVLRRESEGSATLVASLPADATGWTDEGVLPARDYGYALRGVNSVGIGGSSEELVVRTANSLELEVLRGTALDSPKLGKDKLLVSGTLAVGADALAPALDPEADGFRVRFGTDADPLATVVVPPGAPGWKVKRGKATWKSAKGQVPRVTVVLDSRKGTFSVAVASLDFDGAPTTESEVRVQSGGEAAAVLPAWMAKRPGLWKAR